jgi:dihydrofolate synthase / folylpolyglutamate synthase
MWSYAEAIEYLNDTAPQGTSVYGLGRINHLLDLVKHPERSFSCITIVGTNGKGSTLAFLDALLRAHGLKVACHVKPHLQKVTERIRINGSDSTEEEFASALWRVHDAVKIGWTRDDRPTYFELLFAACLCAAQTAEVDVAILEAGLGGRLDAVNAVDADMVVMTSIGLDHTELLGNTLHEIALEKLAVTRPGRPLVCQKNPEEVMVTVREYCEENGVDLYLIPEPEELPPPPKERTFMPYTEADKVEYGLKGSYQEKNRLLAYFALEVFWQIVQPGLFPKGLNYDAIVEGQRTARLPGRWEKFHKDDQTADLILDGAHNPDGLLLAFNELKNEREPYTVIFGAKAGKAVDEIIPDLMKVAQNVIFVPLPDVAFQLPEELTRKAREELDKRGVFSQIHIDWADSIIEGLNRAYSITPPEGTILVTGSLYLAGAVRSIVEGSEKPPLS